MTTYRHDYDRSYLPAIPVMDLEVSIERDTPAVIMPALVDSGADATILPIEVLRKIDAPLIREKWLRSATGERHLVNMYQVYLRFGEFGRYMIVVGDNFGGEATIGRDILNRYIVTLNGIDSVVEVSD